MRHSSIKMNTPCEFINIVPLNPLISKCQIKVCYVGDTENRNKSVITKETAKKLANSLPGSPIVGYYNEDIQDFDEHTKELVIKNGELVLKEKTKPYGFVDLNARCWFQKYIDDGTNEREYLMTEGYLWTGQFPECKRIIEQGNNQSMELDTDSLNAYWTKDVNGNYEFFIINDGLISKLCILGDEQEPCFEGSTITKPKIEFTFDNDFKDAMQLMICQLQEILTKGGSANMENKDKNMIPDEYKKKDDDKQGKKDETKQEESNKTDNNTEEEDKKKKKEFSEEVCPKCGKPVSECTCKKEYSLEEIPEYIQLKTEFSALQGKYDDLIGQMNTLTQSLTSLQEFKTVADKKEKLAMIDQFYMLSDKDKEDVVKNIDTYSLEDIENKLSVICFRNKVNFNAEENNAEDKDNAQEEKKDPTTYNLNGLENNSVPAWVRAVAATQGNM